MMKKIVAAKLHGIKVTGADLHYHGSITLDPEHCKRAGIVPLEFVDIWNKTNGQRISTYVIYGTPGAGECVLNGGAARTCEPGDELIICSNDMCETDELTSRSPTVLTFTKDNKIGEVLTYRVTKNDDGTFDFAIEKDGEAQDIPYRSN